MNHTLRLLALIALLCAAGYVHGLWTDRWSNSGELEAALARLDRVPAAFGEWQSKDLELDPRQARQAGIARYLLRRYESRKDGRSLVVLLACGRSGPLAVHTPDICYRGAGYKPAGSPAGYRLERGAGAPAAALWTTKFSKVEAAVPTHLRVHWTWYGGGSWQAPANPRFQFAGLPALYKLYVIQDPVRPDERLDEEACRGFLRELLAELDNAFRA